MYVAAFTDGRTLHAADYKTRNHGITFTDESGATITFAPYEHVRYVYQKGGRRPGGGGGGGGDNDDRDSDPGDGDHDDNDSDGNTNNNNNNNNNVDGYEEDHPNGGEEDTERAGLGFGFVRTILGREPK